MLPPLLPCSFERVADGEENSRAHEERGLPDPARALDRAQVLPLHVFEEGDVELLGDVAEAGDFVCSRPFGKQGARGAVPEAFLRGEEALTLHEGAFDLAVVDGRVDAAADVHFDVRAQGGPVAGQGVDFDRGGRDALGEVEEHFACVGAPDVADVGGAVEAVGGEVDAVEVGGVGEVFQRGVGAEFGAVGGQARVELFAGVEDGVAV